MLLCWHWHHYNVFFGNMCHTKPIHLLFIHVFHILTPKMTCQCQLVIRDTCSCCVVYSFLSNFTLIHKIEHHSYSLSQLLGRTIDSNPCRNKHQVTCNAAIHFKITVNSTEGEREKNWINKKSSRYKEMASNNSLLTDGQGEQTELVAIMKMRF